MPGREVPEKTPGTEPATLKLRWPGAGRYTCVNALKVGDEGFGDGAAAVGAAVDVAGGIDLFDGEGLFV